MNWQWGRPCQLNRFSHWGINFIQVQGLIMADEYEKLRKRLNEMATGYPATPSGIETYIRIAQEWQRNPLPG